MKKMRRVVAILFAGALVCGLAACGSFDTSVSKETEFTGFVHTGEYQWTLYEEGTPSSYTGFKVSTDIPWGDGCGDANGIAVWWVDEGVVDQRFYGTVTDDAGHDVSVTGGSINGVVEGVLLDIWEGGNEKESVFHTWETLSFEEGG